MILSNSLNEYIISGRSMRNSVVTLLFLFISNFNLFSDDNLLNYYEIKVHDGPVNLFEVVDNGNKIATSSGKNLKLWDMESKDMLDSFFLDYEFFSLSTR